MKTYELEFDVGALKEWHKLDGSIRAQFKKQLAKRLQAPHVVLKLPEFVRRFSGVAVLELGKSEREGKLTLRQINATKRDIRNALRTHPRSIQRLLRLFQPCARHRASCRQRMRLLRRPARLGPQ